MKRVKYALLAAWLLTTLAALGQSKNPYKSLGKKSETLTLTQGKYEEFFDQDSIQQIGTALINVQTLKVVKLLSDEEAKNRLENEKQSRFLSVDPISSSYPMLTPYQFASNSPIAGIDLDGAEFKYYALDWKDKSYTKLKVGNQVSIDNDIKLKVTFTMMTNGISTQIDVPITLDRSLIGLSGDFVNYKGRSVMLPGSIDRNNLPTQTDPIWESFQTDDEIDENFVGALRQIVEGVQNITAFKGIIASGGLPTFLKNNGLAQKIADISALRRGAVKNAWAEEKELIEKTGRGTRDWTKKEIAELKKRGKVNGYEGHHINSVADNPGMAGDANNIKFVKGRKGNLQEHGGDFRNPTSGQLIDRKKMIEEFEKNKTGN